MHYVPTEVMKSSSVCGQAFISSTLACCPPNLSRRDLHRPMLFCQEIETVGMVPGQASPPRALPVELFGLHQLFGPIDPWLAILWLCGMSHTHKGSRPLSLTLQMKKFFGKAEIWIWGCQRSDWGCVCISDYVYCYAYQRITKWEKSPFRSAMKEKWYIIWHFFMMYIGFC